MHTLKTMKGRMIKDIVRKYALLFVMLSFLCFLIPYTGDDWAWGSRIGMQLLNEGFAGYNGRYFSNLLEILLTRSRILKAVVMSAFLCGIVYLTERISDKKYSFCLSCFLLAFIPKNVLRQGILWTAGYTNYTVSVFFVLLYIAYIRDFLKKDASCADCRNRLI